MLSTMRGSDHPITEKRSDGATPRPPSDSTDKAVVLDAVTRVVVLPLAFGNAAPGRRTGSFGGGTSQPAEFSSSHALEWVPASVSWTEGHRAGPLANPRPSFLRHGMNVTGRHEWATVAILAEDGYEEAAGVVESLLAADGTRIDGGVLEWAPALVIIGDETRLGLHVACFDDQTNAELDRRLLERAGLVGWVTFRDWEQESVLVDVEGVAVEGVSNPLRLRGLSVDARHGIARQCPVASALDARPVLGERISALNAQLKNRRR